jgi:hypothetical protein
MDVDKVLEKLDQKRGLGSSDQEQLTVENEEELTKDDEKKLRASKNSFLLHDEEKSSEESTTSSMDDFINNDLDSDTTSTSSAMSRLSIRCESSDDDLNVNYRKLVGSNTNVKDFGVQANGNLLTISSANIEISSPRKSQRKEREISISSKGIQAL